MRNQSFSRLIPGALLLLVGCALLALSHPGPGAAAMEQQAGPLLASPPPPVPAASLTRISYPRSEGVPVITPRFPSDDPHAITFVEQDVRDRGNQGSAGRAGVPLQYISIVFTTEGQLAATGSPYMNRTLAPDRVLVVVEYTVADAPQHTIMVFDAHTGNILYVIMPNT